MRTKALMLAPLVAALLVGAGCGGDGDSDEAKDRLKEALTADFSSVDSAVSALDISGSFEGVQSGDFALSLAGPVSFGAQGESGEFDWTVDASVTAGALAAFLGSDTFEVTGGVTLADDELFVTYDDTSYVADEETNSRFAPSLQSAFQVSNIASGVDEEQAQEFVDALDEASIEGEEDVEGEPTTHISGTTDGEALSALAPEGGDAVPEGGESAEVDFDLWIADSDNLVRKAQFDSGVDLPESVGSQIGIESLDVSIVSTISELNEAPEIEAPSDAKPLSRLLEGLGLDETFQIPGLGEGLTDPGAGAAPDGGAEDGPADEPDAGDAAPDLDELNELQSCLEAAGSDQDALQACLEQG